MTENLPIESTPHGNPLARMPMSPNVNAGAVAVEMERAVAEAQGQMTLAKRFPRDMDDVLREFLTSCRMREFAETAFYTVQNRGTGPSIRFAEECARCYGNVEYGHRELSRSHGRSEVEVFAWDKERNIVSKRQITILHEVYTKTGIKKLTNPTDIDNLIANVAAKQMRGRILAILPKHVVEAGKAECKQTLAGGNDRPDAKTLEAMVTMFGRLGVTKAHLLSYVNLTSLDAITVDEVAELRGVWTAIKDEGRPVTDYFDLPKPESASAKAIMDAAKPPQAPQNDNRKPVEEPRKRAEERRQESVDTRAASASTDNEPPPVDAVPPGDDEDVF